MQNLRKISIGPDYQNAMHYQVGKPVQNGKLIIHSIVMSELVVDVYVQAAMDSEMGEEGDILKWKSITVTYPMVLEHKLDF